MSTPTSKTTASPAAGSAPRCSAAQKLAAIRSIVNGDAVQSAMEELGVEAGNKATASSKTTARNEAAPPNRAGRGPISLASGRAAANASGSAKPGAGVPLEETIPIPSPQAGPQAQFLDAQADIAIYGGAAGGGKTWALLRETLRHMENPAFNAVIFRRNAVQARNPGGLWDEALAMYAELGAKPVQQRLEWAFPSGARVKFAHLERESTVLAWQGSQVPLICFDELTHFSRGQFFYMLSRNRGTCGVRPYVRATCNPDADSWLAEFIAWWICQNTGLPLPARSGALRWMIRLGDKIIWADSAAELTAAHGPDCAPKSVTFIASSLFDNKILMRADPGYLANLKALPRVERERLLHGNWKIRPAAGLYFRRAWVNVVDEAPADLRLVRAWDLAATEKTDRNDPDFTASVKMGLAQDGRIYVLHGLSLRKSPLHVQNAILNLAAQDGAATAIALPRDPGQAGKAQAAALTALLIGHKVYARPESGDKISRFSPFSAQCEAGNVCFVRGDWNEEFFNQLEQFPDAPHDDHADACATAFNYLTQARTPIRINRGILRAGGGAGTTRAYGP